MCPARWGCPRTALKQLMETCVIVYLTLILDVKSQQNRIELVTRLGLLKLMPTAALRRRVRIVRASRFQRALTTLASKSRPLIG